MECSPGWDIQQHLHQQRRLIQHHGGTVCSPCGLMVLCWSPGKALTGSRRKTIQQGWAWKIMVISPPKAIFRKHRVSSLNPPSPHTPMAMWMRTPGKRNLLGLESSSLLLVLAPITFHHLPARRSLRDHHLDLGIPKLQETSSASSSNVGHHSSVDN